MNPQRSTGRPSDNNCGRKSAEGGLLLISLSDGKNKTSNPEEQRVARILHYASNKVKAAIKTMGGGVTRRNNNTKTKRTRNTR